MAEVRDVHFATVHFATLKLQPIWVGLTQIWNAHVFLQQAKLLDVSQRNYVLQIFTLGAGLAVPCNRQLLESLPIVLYTSNIGRSLYMKLKFFRQHQLQPFKEARSQHAELKTVAQRLEGATGADTPPPSKLSL